MNARRAPRPARFAHDAHIYTRGVSGTLAPMHAPLDLVHSPSGGRGRAVAGPAALAALEARQLRLLAHAVGDHLPIELVLEVAALEMRRRRLLATVAGL